VENIFFDISFNEKKCSFLLPFADMASNWAIMRRREVVIAND
jgi:hypothetical protein